MDIDKAITEPAARLIEFHNRFNRNVKVSFGALEALSTQAPHEGGAGPLSLPTGTEPWGSATRWRELHGPIKDAAEFLAEVGIARASAAFEDYLIGAKAEFDRAGLVEVRPKRDGAVPLQGLDAVLGIDPSTMVDLVRMATFFDVARNCVVHRSNRASQQLAELREDPRLAETLVRWPKRVAKWTLSLPSIVAAAPVEWRPRHAIMASDVYYRCAIMLDQRLVQLMGERGIVRMAAHWCFFAEPSAPNRSKLDGGTMVRSLLVYRYKVKSTTMAEVIARLRDVDRWDDVRAAFHKLYPDGAQSAAARKRRERKRNFASGCRVPRSRSDM